MDLETAFFLSPLRPAAPLGAASIDVRSEIAAKRFVLWDCDKEGFFYFFEFSEFWALSLTRGNTVYILMQTINAADPVCQHLAAQILPCWRSVPEDLLRILSLL